MLPGSPHRRRPRILIMGGTGTIGTQIGDTVTTVRDVTGAAALGWAGFVERNRERFG